MLDTKTLTPDQERHLAADSRFFIDQGVQFEDLGDLQEAIGNMTFVMRAKSDETQNRADLPTLTFLLDSLGARLDDHKGHIVMAVPHSATSTYESFQAIAGDYQVPYDDESIAVLFVPTDKISAIRPNPQFYGTGEDVLPVVNFGIETAVVDAHGHEATQRRWLQVPAATTPIALFSETI